MFYLYIHTKFHPSNSPIPQESQKDDHAMKTKLSLFLATLVCGTGLAQTHLYGSYDNIAFTTYLSLKIYDNHFIVTRIPIPYYNNPSVHYRGEPPKFFIYAQGTFTWVNDRFIEIHAESPKSIVDRSIKMTQTKYKKAEQLTVVLKTPIPNDLNAQIFYSTDDTINCNMSVAMTPVCDLENLAKHHVVSLPANTKKFYIKVIPKDTYFIFGRRPSNYRYYNTPLVEVGKDIGRISIKIPELKRSFFTCFLVDGDYALVEHDTVCWRGAKYPKCHNLKAIKIKNGEMTKEIWSRARKKHATTVFHVDKPDSLPTDLSGVYYDNTGRRLELFNDKFLFVAHPDSSWQWYDTIYAEATYSREDEQFIQLHAESPYAKIKRTIEYSSMIDESKSDSIDFYLKLPNIGDIKLDGWLSSEIDIEGPAWKSHYEDVDFEYVQGDTAPIKLPPGKQILDIYMSLKEPIAPIPPDSIENTNFGPSDVSFESIEITDDNTSQYTVTIPGLDPSYFGEYRVDGDFVRIKQDTLIWQGRTFVKSKLQRDIEYIAGKEAARSKDKAPSSDRTTEGQGSPQATPPTRPKSPATK